MKGVFFLWPPLVSLSLFSLVLFLSITKHVNSHKTKQMENGRMCHVCRNKAGLICMLIELYRYDYDIQIFYGEYILKNVVRENAYGKHGWYGKWKDCLFACSPIPTLYTFGEKFILKICSIFFFFFERIKICSMCMYAWFFILFFPLSQNKISRKIKINKKTA